MKCRGPGDAAPSEAAQQPLRTAMRTNRWIVAALVVAVASPLFIHYTGFLPAKELSGLSYPKIFRYSFRTTPGRAPHHGIDFSQIWLSAGRLSADEPVYYRVDKKKWRIGHFRRALPAGYEAARFRDDPSEMDPALAQYYAKMRLITRGPLLDWERIATIVAFNLGR